MHCISRRELHTPPRSYWYDPKIIRSGSCCALAARITTRSPVNVLVGSFVLHWVSRPSWKEILLGDRRGLGIRPRRNCPRIGRHDGGAGTVATEKVEASRDPSGPRGARLPFGSEDGRSMSPPPENRVSVSTMFDGPRRRQFLFRPKVTLDCVHKSHRDVLSEDEEMGPARFLFWVLGAHYYQLRHSCVGAALPRTGLR